MRLKMLAAFLAWAVIAAHGTSEELLGNPEVKRAYLGGIG